LIRFFLFIIQILLILFLIAFFISNSFTVSFDIGDYKYIFSSNILFGLITGLILISYFFILIYFKTRFSFQKYFFNKKQKQLKKGYDYFIDAMIALANKDNKSAVKANKRMMSYLGNEPTLSLLLQSEIYKIEKKYDQLNDIYDQMIKIKNTESLGYRGLMEQSLNNEDYHHAFIFGEKLFTLNPKIDKLYQTLIHIIAKTKNWNQLIIISDKAYSYKIIENKESFENKSIAFYEIAKIKMQSDIKDALKLIQKALKLKKNFPPYIKLYLEILFLNNNLPQIKKILKKYWSENPNSSLRSVITSVLKNKNLKNIEFIKSIVDNKIDHEESKKLLIEFAIYFSEWNLARNNIKGLIGTNPTKEICLFMSEIELGEFNDVQKSEAWKLRAQNAKLENYWICKISNTPQKNWSTLSVSGYFNSLEWKQPKMLNQYIN